MKKNRYTYLLTTILLAFLILSGCSKSAKQTYLDALNEPVKEEQSTNEYSFSVTDIEFGKNVDSSTRAGLSMLKGIEMKGVTTTDPKKEITQSSFTLDLMGTSMTLETLSDKEYSYLSLESVQNMYDLIGKMGQLSGTASSSEASFFEDFIKDQKLQGKYLKTALSKDDDDEDTASSQEDLSALSKAITKEMHKYFKKIDDKKFSQKDNIITVQLDKGNYQDLTELFLKTIHSKTEYEEAVSSLVPGADLDTIESLLDKKMFSQFKSIDCSLSWNKKTKATSMTLKMSPKDTSLLKSVTIDFNSTPQKFEGTPKLPAKNKIISEEKLAELMTQYYMNNN